MCQTHLMRVPDPKDLGGGVNMVVQGLPTPLGPLPRPRGLLRQHLPVCTASLSVIAAVSSSFHDAICAGHAHSWAGPQGAY